MADLDPWLAATLLLPIAMLAACGFARARARIPDLLWLVPLPALFTAVVAPDGAELVLPAARLGLGLSFRLDRVGAMLLGAAALLWLLAGVYARAGLRRTPGAAAFAIWWLLTMLGNLGVFLAHDMVTFYLFFTIASLAAYGLIVHDQSAPARRAGRVYVAFTLISEAMLLAGFVLLAAATPQHGIGIDEVVDALAQSPWRGTTMALLITAFALKIGLVPLHAWMPLAYSAAPIAAASVLSGAAVKAGVIGLIRFLPFAAPPPHWGQALAAAGLVSAFYGVGAGLFRANPKTVLAYSSVSQMGVLATVLGMGLMAANRHTAIIAAFYATHHVLVKGSLFLALGIAASRGWRLWVVAALALGLAGLPLTGGALAKAAIKLPLSDGAIGLIADLSAVASAILMFHFLRCLVCAPDAEPAPPATRLRRRAWLLLALACVAVPAALFPRLELMTWGEIFGPKPLWDAAWPILVGGLVTLARQSFYDRLPVRRAGAELGVDHALLLISRRFGDAVVAIDQHLRQWPTAALMFVGLVLVLAGALLMR
ncbi:MAG TPA: complex I subunit 5 family protein [Hyphomicrobiaceae bacterium]|nr:complex I subunit 5 family protein [Hyphomicrobiaceae bacterium]